MRRYFLGLAICSLTASAPVVALGGDREIADSIISTLKSQQSDGSLKGFDIDLSVENGIVTLSGSVSNEKQAHCVIEAAQAATGVAKIVNEMNVRDAGKQASTLEFAASGSSPGQNVHPASGVEETRSSSVTVGAEPPKMQSDFSAVSPEDAAITDNILHVLGKDKAAGFLRNFELSVSTVNGEVWVRGYVANDQQKQHILHTSQSIQGVVRVVDDITVTRTDARPAIQQASNTRVISPAKSGSMPVMSPSIPMPPRPVAPSSINSYPEAPPQAQGMQLASTEIGTGMGPMPAPVAMNMGASYGPGVPRYDQPQMPGYAWPSYAAYPNYSAVTYPKQYSASAWPYIGPFYPYPQVPLGWRKVALEWDDGLWYLDFTSK